MRFKVQSSDLCECALACCAYCLKDGFGLGVGDEQPRLVLDDLGVAAVLLVPGQSLRWRTDKLEPLGTGDPRGFEHQRIEAVHANARPALDFGDRPTRSIRGPL